jgi:hypothetical protein
MLRDPTPPQGADIRNRSMPIAMIFSVTAIA